MSSRRSRATPEADRLAARLDHLRHQRVAVRVRDLARARCGRPGPRARRRWRGCRRAAAGSRAPGAAERRRAARSRPRPGPARARARGRPARMSSPRGRTKSPVADRPRDERARRRPRVTSSWGMTASAPSGSGAPVKIRNASPRPSGRSAIAPAGTRPATRRRAGRRRAARRGVGAAEGVAVHRGVGPRRNVARAVHVLGEHAVERRGQRRPARRRARPRARGCARAPPRRRSRRGILPRAASSAAATARLLGQARGPAGSGRGTSCGSARRARRSPAVIRISTGPSGTALLSEQRGEHEQHPLEEDGDPAQEQDDHEHLVALGRPAGQALEQVRERDQPADDEDDPRDACPTAGRRSARRKKRVSTGTLPYQITRYCEKKKYIQKTRHREGQLGHVLDRGRRHLGHARARWRGS